MTPVAKYLAYAKKLAGRVRKVNNKIRECRMGHGFHYACRRPAGILRRTTMLNTILLLIPLTGLCLAVAALLYAVAFRLVGRRPIVVCERVAVTEPEEPGQLSYAPVDLRPPLLCRRPSLVVVPVYLLTAAPLGAILAFFILAAWPMTNLRGLLFWPFAAVAGIAVILFTTGHFILARRAVRRTDGTVLPPAVHWTFSKPVLAGATCLIALLASMGVTELRARHTLAGAEAEISVMQDRLRDPRLGDAKPLYDQASAQFETLGLASTSIGPGAPVIPFPKGAEPIIDLLHRATEPGGPEAAPLPANHVTTLAKLLHCHALQELRLGHWEKANRDLAAIQTMARQYSHGDTFISTLIAVILDGIGDDLFQKVANAATTEAQLDAIAVQPREWHEHLAQRYRETWTLAMHNAPVLTAQGKWSRDSLMIGLQRWILLDGDLRAAREHRKQVLQTPPARWRDGAALASKATLPSPGPMLMLPHFANATQDLLACWVRRDLDEAALAVLRFQMRNGRLPGTMEEVVAAGLLPAIPANRWDLKPMGYSVTAAGATLTAPMGTMVPPPGFSIPAAPATRPAAGPVR